MMKHLPLTDLVPPGRHGRMDGPAGVTLGLVRGLGAAIVNARRTGQPEPAFEHSFGITLPNGPKAASRDGLTAIGIGPRRWLVFCAPATGDELAARLEGAVGGHAALTDQSDAYLVFELSGLHARDALAKMCTLDLDPVAFGPGDAATTSMAFVGVTLWQTDAAPTYRLAVGRSFAPSLLRAFAAGAAQYGLFVEGTGRG